jgi:phenylpropionate dioxygenase-like ring-hydroxylating dioxygenase large terminal subunit
MTTLGNSYLFNSWYVVAWSNELTDQLLARKLLDQNVVLYRTSDGAVVAFEDRCPHRHLPLSMGRKRGDLLQCGYHGMTFDRTGACVAVPSQAATPRKALLKAYSVTERYGWVWIWMGETEAADPGLIPDFHRLTDPAYATVGKTNHVKSGYRLLTDNLLDLSHVGFVHTSTIGNPEMGEKGRINVTRTENGVRVVRLVPDVPPPPTYIKTGVLPKGKNIDRWQIIDFIAPCFVHIHVGGAEAGTGALEGRTEHGLNIWVINAMTPETTETSHYFWATARCHAIHDPKVDHLFLTQVTEAFEEDKRVIEAQQEVLCGRDDSWGVALKADAGSIEARRVLDIMIAAERAAGADDGGA